MATVARPAENLIRQARLAEALTLAWMVVELVVALWAGIVARSVALTTFGVDSGIELFTAAVVLRLFVLHTERATEEEQRGEDDVGKQDRRPHGVVRLRLEDECEAPASQVEENHERRERAGGVHVVRAAECQATPQRGPDRSSLGDRRGYREPDEGEP
jgi:hypothetical protein